MSSTPKPDDKPSGPDTQSISRDSARTRHSSGSRSSSVKADRRTPGTKKRSKRYHHGNLKEALIDAAEDIVIESGHPDFSLREVARKAGVSANAPYRHFKDKEALLDAISHRALIQLRDELAAASKNSENLCESMQEMALAYMHFAQENRGIYRLISESSRPPARFDEHIGTGPSGPQDGLWSAHNAIYEIISEKAAEFHPHNVDVLVIAAWALAHGLAGLVLTSKLEAYSGEELDQLVRGIVIALTPKIPA